jgi:hypothetical protein
MGDGGRSQESYNENYKNPLQTPRKFNVSLEGSTDDLMMSAVFHSRLAFLQADKGNTTLILNTVDYKHKINSFLKYQFYKNWPVIPECR